MAELLNNLKQRHPHGTGRGGWRHGPLRGCRARMPPVCGAHRTRDRDIARAGPRADGRGGHDPGRIAARNCWWARSSAGHDLCCGRDRLAPHQGHKGFTAASFFAIAAGAGVVIAYMLVTGNSSWGRVSPKPILKGEMLFSSARRQFPARQFGLAVTRFRGGPW